MTVHRISMCKCGHEEHPGGACLSCGCPKSHKRGSPVAHDHGGISSDAINDLARIARTLELAAVAIRGYAKDVIAALDRGRGKRRLPLPAISSQIVPPGSTYDRPKSRQLPVTKGLSTDISDGRIVSNSARDTGLGKGELRVLTAIAQHHAGGVTPEQLTVLLGYKRSSRNKYLQILTEAGLIFQDGERRFASDAGYTLLGPGFTPLPTGDKLREHWSRELGGGEKLLFDYICAVYPDAVHRETLGQESGYARSSRNKYLQHLAARGLIVDRGGSVIAVADLFEVRKAAS